MRIRYLPLALGILAVGACKDPNRPDLNNPSVNDFSNITSLAQVSALVTGVLNGDRGVNENQILLGEILGHDAYEITASEGRFTTELLGVKIDPSDFLGTSNYPYGTIRVANIGIDGVQGAPSALLTDAQKATTVGFLQTMKALELTRAIEMHDTTGVPIDVDIAPTGPPAPIRCKPAVLDAIAALLDSAATNLGAGGDFPFTLPPGFAGFDTPATFLTFNRGLAAKIDIYRAFINGPTTPDAAALDSADAELAASFLDTTDPANLEVGPEHTYSTASGDATNGLFQNGTFFANPIVDTNAVPGDARLAARTIPSAVGSGNGVSSTLQWNVYTSPTTPTPIMLNVELVLMQAEVDWGKGDLPGAMTLVNFVRTNQGQLPPTTATTSDAVLNAILYEKRYSLLFQSADRFIDARMFGKYNTAEPPAGIGPARGSPLIPNFPIPQSEINARNGDIACQP